MLEATENMQEQQATVDRDDPSIEIYDVDIPEGFGVKERDCATVACDD
jgi:hypothetical protein